jgi:ATPase subunit of ABC transporter with duplicated ATPase domains
MTKLREWTQSTRRALQIDLTPSFAVPASLGPASTVVDLRGVAELDLALRRDRIGIAGPNGAGKTTLLQILLGQRLPAEGTAWRDLSKIGAIDQGGANWMLDASLVERLAAVPNVPEWLVAHRFPLALADRPLGSLSPGERARAALLCLFASAPPVEMLVLDEPTFSLDLVGQRAMTEALRAWPGGLVVASHDRAFLERIGLDRIVELAKR